MKKLVSAMLVAAVFVTTGAFAEPEKHMAIKIAGDGDVAHETISINLSGSEIDFDLDDMQVGESRSVVDESGRSILITRGEDGYTFDVDGKSIEVPMLAGDYAHMVSKEVSDIDIDVVAAQGMAMHDLSDGIMIISGEPLDTSTKDSIRAVLQSAGHDTEVRFIDGGHSDGERHVKVIRKQVVKE